MELASITYLTDKDESKTITGELAVKVGRVIETVVPLAVSAHASEVEALEGWQKVAAAIVASDISFRTTEGKTDFAGRTPDAATARAAIFSAINDGLKLDRWMQLTGKKASDHKYRKSIALYMEGARKQAFAKANAKLDGKFDGTNPSYGGHLTGQLAEAFKAETKLDPRARNLRDKAPATVPPVSVTDKGIVNTPVAGFTSMLAILRAADVSKLSALNTADRAKVRKALTLCNGRIGILLDAVAPVQNVRKAS